MGGIRDYYAINAWNRQAGVMKDKRKEADWKKEAEEEMQSKGQQDPTLEEDQFQRWLDGYGI